VIKSAAVACSLNVIYNGYVFNFSRIDSATLNLTLTPKTVNSGGSSRSATIKVFAVNYNVLRIMSGMGGLAYSN